MTTMTWSEQFAPLKDSLGLHARKEQQTLADAIISSMNADIGTSHVCAEAGTGTGKSFAYLIPLIHKVAGTEFRGVVSTETLTLQDQVAYKDLPLLSKVYGNFSYMSLKGRSNYVCLTRANVEAVSHPEVIEYIDLIEKKMGQFTEGTQAEVSRILKESIPEDIWRYISGESEFCADCSDTESEGCFGSIARKKAPAHDIIVTNHALLKADADMDSALLGEHEFVVIDEAHTLEDVFIGSLQEDLSSYDLYKHKKNISEGVEPACSILGDDSLVRTAEFIAKDLDKTISAMLDFYKAMTPGSWDNAEGILKEMHLIAPPGSVLGEAMRVVEEELPDSIDSLVGWIAKLTENLVEAQSTLRESSGKKAGLRKIGKAVTSLREINRVMRMMKDSITSKDGIVMSYGVPYVVEYKGKIDEKYSVNRMDFSFVPLDVSTYMRETLWGYDLGTQKAKKTCIILSATLTDITDGSFRYATTSIGFPGAGVTSLTVHSPFDYNKQQIVYTTPGNRDIIPVERAQFSMDEAVDLVKMSKGRALLLFTAKSELAYAAEDIRRRNLPYRILVQDGTMTKNELAEAFMADESSVLLATKSFFTGVNFSGDACSMVIMCKFPLKRFNGVCRAQIDWWRAKGFNSWYEMQALTVFRQAAGRLIRSETDRGVIAIIDKRVSSPKEKVHKTASLGVSTLGSVVTNSMQDLQEFFDE